MSAKQSGQAEIEVEDAKTVDRAAEVLRRLDLAEVERLLLPVIANTPANYVTEFEEDGTRYVKFWDLEEFTAHSMRSPSEAARLVWLPNAYPRAHYYMAYVSVERQQPHEALRWLDVAIRLEPTQPRLWLEKATVLSSLGQHAEAITMYQSVLDNAALLAPSVRATALRGRGLQLIELGDLDEAERCFLESLTIDSDSPVAQRELEYIHHLRSGGEAAPLETAAWPKSTSRACAARGSGVLLAAPDSGDKVICEDCTQRGIAIHGCGCMANQVLCDGFAAS